MCSFIVFRDPLSSSVSTHDRESELSDLSLSIEQQINENVVPQQCSPPPTITPLSTPSSPTSNKSTNTNTNINRKSIVSLNLSTTSSTSSSHLVSNINPSKNEAETEVIDISFNASETSVDIDNFESLLREAENEVNVITMSTTSTITSNPSQNQIQISSVSNIPLSSSQTSQKETNKRTNDQIVDLTTTTTNSSEIPHKLQGLEDISDVSQIKLLSSQPQPSGVESMSQKEENNSHLATEETKQNEIKAQQKDIYQISDDSDIIDDSESEDEIPDNIHDELIEFQTDNNNNSSNSLIDQLKASAQKKVISVESDTENDNSTFYGSRHINEEKYGLDKSTESDIETQEQWKQLSDIETLQRELQAEASALTQQQRGLSRGAAQGDFFSCEISNFYSM
jgi:hypothetical protein